jgi:hypothetical protein
MVYYPSVKFNLIHADSPIIKLHGTSDVTKHDTYFQTRLVTVLLPQHTVRSLEFKCVPPPY